MLATEVKKDFGSESVIPGCLESLEGFYEVFPDSWSESQKGGWVLGPLVDDLWMRYSIDMSK